MDSGYILKRMRLAVIPAWGGGGIRERARSRILQFGALAPGRTELLLAEFRGQRKGKLGDAQGLGCNAVYGWCQRTFRWSVQEASHKSRARSPESRRQRASVPHRTCNLQGAGSFHPAASHGLAACDASPG